MKNFSTFVKSFGTQSGSPPIPAAVFNFKYPLSANGREKNFKCNKETRMSIICPAGLTGRRFF